jgi:hypothetical protein
MDRESISNIRSAADSLTELAEQLSNAALEAGNAAVLALGRNSEGVKNFMLKAIDGAEAVSSKLQPLVEKLKQTADWK